MKTSTLLFSAALALASTASSFGQVITTLETISLWNGVSNLSVENGQPLSQTMKLPVATPAIYSMTWRFTNASSIETITTSTLDAYFAEWSAGAPIGAPLWSSTGIVIPATPGAYDLVLTPNIMTDPTKTYAMILIGTSVDANLQAPIADSGTGFPYGRAVILGEEDGSAFTYSDLMSNPSSNLVGDWVFSQIVLSDSILTPIPETGTVAVAFAGIVVAGLGLRRRRHAESRAAFAAA